MLQRWQRQAGAIEGEAHQCSWLPRECHRQVRPTHQQEVLQVEAMSDHD